MRPQHSADAVAVTFHRRSGWGSIVAAIVVLIVAEGLAVHMLLAQWSALAAWIMTGLDLYGILWLLGDYQALRLRPALVGKSKVQLRWGLRWSMDIPREMIARVEQLTGDVERRQDRLRIAALDEPELMVVLKQPLIAEGPFGFRKKVCEVALLPDDPSAFHPWIDGRL